MANYIKWMFVFIIMALGIASNYMFAEALPIYLRALAVLASVAIATIVFVQTSQGIKTREFVLSARNEMRKIVWPSRQETMQASLVVIIMVLVMSIILWGVDSSLFMIMSWFTGQGE